MDIRKDFPIFQTNPALAYLDSAATSLMPLRVQRAVSEYDSVFRSNVHRGEYAEAVRATEAYEDARKEVADFIGSHADEIIFTAGTTGSLNMLALLLERSLSVGLGHTITATSMEHHSALLPFRTLCMRSGARFASIPLTSFNLDLSSLERYIPEGTKIVVATLASNVLGTLNDLSAITARAHAVGALMVVDAAKAVGHIAIDVRKLDCDFLAFSAHKIFGPTGVGVLYGRRKELARLEPLIVGGGMVMDMDEHSIEFAEGISRFEAGTPPIAGVIGLGEAIRYLKDIGLENLRTRVVSLVEYGIQALERIDGIALYAERTPSKNAGVLNFTLAGIHVHDVAQILADENIAVRAGHHCAIPLMRSLGLSGTVRASLHGYNTKEEIDRLASVIKKTQTIFA